MGARGDCGHELPGALCGLRPQAVAVSLKRFRVPYSSVVFSEPLPQPGVDDVEVVTPSRGEIAPFECVNQVSVAREVEVASRSRGERP